MKIIGVTGRSNGPTYGVLTSWHPELTGGIRIRLYGVEVLFKRRGSRFVSDMGWSVSVAAVKEVVS